MNRPVRYALSLAVAAIALFGHGSTAHAVYCEPYPNYGDSSPSLTLTTATVAGRALTEAEVAEYKSFSYGLHIDAPDSPDVEVIVIGGAPSVLQLQEVFHATP